MEPSGRWDQLQTPAGKGTVQTRGPQPGQPHFRKEVLGDAELWEWDGDLRAGLRAAGAAGWTRCAGAGLGIPATPRPGAQSQATLPVYTV